MKMNLTYVFVNYNNTNESILTIDSILSAEFDNSDYIIIIDNNSNAESIEMLETYLK